jgi:DNA-binding response OmpR family regulator
VIEPTITAIVIDDDLDTVELFCEHLELKGIQVIGKGHDGKEAVELYQKMKPDIVFLDIMMPYYNGFYAAEEIQKVEPNAKIIMVTADLTSDTAHKLEELKLPVIYKPYEFDDIMIIIHKLLQYVK